MIKLILYMLVAALVAFSLIWISDEIRKNNPKFFYDFGDEQNWPWIVVAATWPFTAFIAYGYLAAKYVRTLKKE